MLQCSHAVLRFPGPEVFKPLFVLSSLKLASNKSPPLLQNSWDDLFALLQEGSEEAFDSIFREFYPKLVGFAKGYGGLSLDQSEDLVSEIFTWIWQFHAEITIRSSFEAYLYRSVRNKVLNKKRDQKNRRSKAVIVREDLLDDLVSRQVDADKLLETQELKDQVARCITSLSETQRLIITLRWSNQWDWKKIAEVVGITAAAAQMNHTRALRIIRASFE